MADGNPGDLEGEPIGDIDFVVGGGNAPPRTCTIECALKTATIGGLKQDNEEEFGIPSGSQRWYFEGKLLRDHQTLLESGIEMGVQGKSTIIVERA